MIRPSLDYTDRDFTALRARARQLISAAFPEWDNDTFAAFENILIDFMCFNGDVTAFYQNKQARETRWTQATQRKNLLSQTKLITYVPAGATAATAEQTFNLAAAMVAPVRLAAGTQVSTLEVTQPIKYQLLEELVITAGQTTITATVENSEFESDTFTSNGAANQSVTLTRTPFLPGSLRINAADGDYVQVDNFLLSGRTDRHFVVVVDQNDRARVDFGNGIRGAIPAGLIHANYKTGGGSAGRVEAGALRKIDGTFADDFGNLAIITTTNALASEGGDDRQSNASIREQAPESLRVVGKRTIAREDYEIVAKKLTTLVSRALMVTRSEDPTVPFNAGVLFLVPPGAGTVPQTTFDAVRALFLLYPYAPSFDLSIQQAVYLIVNVFARVYLTKGAVAEVVRAAIILALTRFFEDRISDPDAVDEDGLSTYGAENLSIDFGWKLQNASGDPDGTLALTDVENVVRDIPGVRKIDAGVNGFLLNSKRADLPIALRQFPKLGTITIINADTGNPL